MQGKTIAWCGWAAGMIIGFMPLLTHFFLWTAARPQTGWTDNRAPDLLFVTISNSGLVAVTVFTRLLAGAYDISNLSPNQRVVRGITRVSFSIAAMLYGVDVTAMAGPAIWMTALVPLIASAFLPVELRVGAGRYQEE